MQITGAYHEGNLPARTKHDYKELIDVYAERNGDKHAVYQYCEFRKVKKIVQDRIYPCCVVFGQALRQGFSPESVSVPFDENWRENLAKVTIEQYCRRCCVDVDAPKGRWWLRQWWRLKRAFTRGKHR